MPLVPIKFRRDDQEKVCSSRLRLPENKGTKAMLRSLLRILLVSIIAITILAATAFADDQPANRSIQEEVWAIPVTLPTIAYVVRPVGDGPFPLVIMNHGVSLNQRERSFFPLVEFRDAAMWFARRGYMVVAPSGSGYGAAALDEPERGLYSVFYSKIGGCDNPNFRDAGLAAALMDKWVIDYMADQKLIVPDDVIVVGQSAGGWGAIALSSRNVPGVRAIITFAAGRGGRVGGKPNNNCAPDKLVEATAEFGRTARIPMLWIYAENDTFFGPALSSKMHEAYTGAGGRAEYQMLPPFGSDGHFLIDSADAIPLWAPLVSQFLDKHQ
jgi:dienelactone hydrolase